jgi:hypothetical protein
MVPEVTPSFYFRPRYTNPYGVNTWLEHIPFAYDLVQSVRPALLVELGTYYGESYFGFCQAVEEAGIECECRAVDTWSGDAQAGFYHEDVFAQVEAHHRKYYRRFSSLIRARFDDAIGRFQDGTISILHIDGLHTYDAVSHDFGLWLPKVRPGGIVLLHDIAEQDNDFGVWRLWAELQPNFPTFSFYHGHGLGVLRKHGDRGNDLVTEMVQADLDRQDKFRRYYAQCGAQLSKEAGFHPRHARVQLFYPGVEGYSERLSQSAFVRLNDWQPVRFRTAMTIGGQLRLDPLELPGIVEISELVIERCDNFECLWSLDPASANQVGVMGTALRVPSDDAILTVLSTGPDPRLLLPEIAAAHNGVSVRAIMRIRTEASELAAFLGSTLQHAAAGSPSTPGESGSASHLEVG